jgi:4-alpha-glucanotransferase
LNNVLNQRRAGVLLHITSLPGHDRQGDLGQNAYYFVDFLQNCGVSVWQTLPLGMPHGDGSPYQCLSAHAGNPELISLDQLVQSGWLSFSDQGPAIRESREFNKSDLVAQAYYGFLDRASEQDQEDFKQFCEAKAFWLDDFALFIVLRNEFDCKSWNLWPERYKERDPKALKEMQRRFQREIGCIKFEQYVFYRQWLGLKHYANQKDVLLFGDVPIFVSYDSADVWTNRAIFKLDESGEMRVVAGVPPDYFSANGQRWGNPHYDWNALQKNGFDWWIKRMSTQQEQFDILRIDHFRGFEAAWEIPAHEDTAINGIWVQAPGRELLWAINNELGAITLVAEDLGVITPEVEMLRDEFELPGMKILHFAFGGNTDNPYLPNHYTKNCVVYTGTHDNDTTIGWVHKLSHPQKHFIYDYLGFPSIPLHWALMQAALSSVANLAVIPMQDILELDAEHRMNTPGTTTGNWNWRFQWCQLTDERAGKLAHLIALFDRKRTD